MPYTHIDCFSGPGGFCTGLHAAGFETKVAIEYIKSCVDTYSANHPEVHVMSNMLDCLFFTTRVSILINMDRQSCNGLRKNSDTGVDCSHLHGTSFVDGFARVASTEEKAIGTAIGTVGGLVSGMK